MKILQESSMLDCKCWWQTFIPVTNVCLQGWLITVTKLVGKQWYIWTLKVSFSDADSDDLESLGAFAVASFKPQPGKKRKNESSKDGQKNPKQGKYKRNGYIYSTRKVHCGVYKLSASL